jgi:hypothetical protein
MEAEFPLRPYIYICIRIYIYIYNLYLSIYLSIHDDVQAEQPRSPQVWLM